MEELTQLLNSSSNNNASTSDIINQLNQLLIWTIVPTIIFGVIFLIIYILRTIRHRKVENAIFEIRDLLKNMQPLQPPANPATDIPEISTPE